MFIGDDQISRPESPESQQHAAKGLLLDFTGTWP